MRNNIDWQFNPPTAAHMGEVWERMVGAVKKICKAILSNVQLTDEILENSVNMMNSEGDGDMSNIWPTFFGKVGAFVFAYSSKTI